MRIKDGGRCALTSGVEETFAVADRRIFLCEGPVRPAESLRREDHLVIELLELPQELDGAPGQDDVIAENKMADGGAGLEVREHLKSLFRAVREYLGNSFRPELDQSEPKFPQ